MKSTKSIDAATSTVTQRDARVFRGYELRALEACGEQIGFVRRMRASLHQSSDPVGFGARLDYLEASALRGADAALRAVRKYDELLAGPPGTTWLMVRRAVA
jgi:hypothetical protein